MSRLRTPQPEVDKALAPCVYCREPSAFACDAVCLPARRVCGRPLCFAHATFWDLAPGKVLVRCPLHREH